MNALSKLTSGPVFEAPARERFAAAYPEVPHVLEHGLGRHPLLAHRAVENPCQQAIRAYLQFGENHGYIQPRRKTVLFLRPVAAVDSR